MANNIIDADAMYRAGYGSKIDPTKDRTMQTELINKGLGMVGEWVIGKYKNAFAELKTVKKLGRKTKGGVQIEMDKLGEELAPGIQDSLDLFKSEEIVLRARDYANSIRYWSFGIRRKPN